MTLKTRVAKLEKKAGTERKRLWLVLENEDGTYSVEGDTLTHEEFERWQETLPRGARVFIVDF